MVALLAFLIPDWKYLNLATSAPGLLIILVYFYLPESVRWLLVNDRMDEVEQTLKRVAKVNCRIYPTKCEIKSQKNNSSNRGGNILELFHHRPTAIHTLVCMFVWFACSMVYYGVSLSTGKLGGNIYLVFFLTSIIAIPANFAATFFINRYGRKKSLSLSLFVTAFTMIGAALMPTDHIGFVISRVALAMIAKFLITTSFNAAYLITLELLPTTLRNMGMGLSSAAARIGSFSASYVIFLSEVNHILPFILMGIIAVLSAIVSFILPETKDQPTKETISDDKKEDEMEMKV